MKILQVIIPPEIGVSLLDFKMMTMDLAKRNHTKNNIRLLLLLMVGIALHTEVRSQKPQDSLQSFNNGKKLFRTYCSSCHGIHHENIGPLLASITKKRSRDWVIQFIRNSQFVITQKDEYAKALYSSYNHVMPSFGKFDSLEINDLLYYIEKESKVPIEDSKLDLNILQNSNPDILNGRELFNQQCSNCHSVYYEQYGPALGSITKRLDKKWLYSFIRNSQKVIKQGDPYAKYVFDSYNHRIMVSMEFLTDEQIKSILTYIEYASTTSDLTKTIFSKAEKPLPSVESGVHGKQTSKSALILFKILIGLVLLTSIVAFGYLMIRINRYLKNEHRN